MAQNIIDENSIANVYLFFGEEEYKKRLYRERLKSLIAGDGSMNYRLFEGKDTDFSAVYDSVVTLPFFAERRLVIVRDTGVFASAKGSSNGAAASSGSKDNSAKAEGGTPPGDSRDALLIRILEDLPSTTCLAFFETDVNRTKKTYKTIAKGGVVCECSPDSRDKVVMWLAKGFKAADKNIRRSTAELIVDRAGTDYDRLRNEYEKIIAYADGRSEITDDDVIAVTEEDIEARIFEMIDSMCAGNIGRVLEKYYGLTANREHPLYIMAMIRSQFRTMLQVSELKKSGLAAGAIAAKLKKRDFVVTKSLKNMRCFSPAQAAAVLERISDTDMRIKTGDINDQIGVEMLLIDITRKASGK